MEFVKANAYFLAVNKLSDYEPIFSSLYLVISQNCMRLAGAVLWQG